MGCTESSTAISEPPNLNPFEGVLEGLFEAIDDYNKSPQRDLLKKYISEARSKSLMLFEDHTGEVRNDELARDLKLVKWQKDGNSVGQYF